MKSIDLVSNLELISQPVVHVSADAPSESGLLPVSGIDQPIILSYFQTLNRGDFAATSQLFAADGVLQPPFDAAVVGPDEIMAYLETEATGLVLHPQQGTSNALEDGCTEWNITGKVQTPFFSVNVVWQLVLSPTNEIFLAKVKLLASLQELFQFRQKPDEDSPAN